MKPQHVWIWTTTEVACTISASLQPPQWIVWHNPLLEIVPIAPTQQYFPHNYERIIFVSANAVKYGLSHFYFTSSSPQNMPSVFLMGKSQQETLTQYFLNCHSPAHGNDTEALLSEAHWHNIIGKKVLLVKGEDGRKLLSHTLRQRGAKVHEAVVYQRRTNEKALKEVTRKMEQHSPDWIIAGSRAILEAFHEGCRQNWIAPILQSKIKQTPVLVHHWRIRDIAIEYGFKILYTAQNLMAISPLLHKIINDKEHE